jgi:hypothetical protein
VNSVKQVHASFMITVFLLLAFLPVVLPSGTVSAQTTGYTIQKVDHQVEVMYSGQVVIRDTIHVYGQVTDGFMIGLPSKYSAYILKAVAFDADNVYQVNLGVQLGDRSGFYGAEVNFNGKSPSVFTVAFVLSNSLITYASDAGVYTLDFPAYPSLTQDVASCNVTITFPSAPSSITVTKSDGEVDTDNYVTQNLAAYTYSIGSVAFQIPTGTLQLTSISQLNRQITIDPTGKVTSSDSYHITNNSTSTMTAFVLNLPTTASNIVVKDEFGRVLTTATSPLTSRDILLANATLITFLTSGQSTIITADYNLPSATIQGSQYVLGDFKLFPNFYYYVDHATFTFIPPEGATIVTPQLSSLDSSATLTRESFQDTLTVTRDGISYLDYSSPESNTVQLSYDYNPVWVSFRPTFWVSFLAVIGCVAAVFIRRRKPSEKEPTITRTERLPTQQPMPTTSSQQAKSVEPITGQRITTENVREFTDDYEEKKQLNAELKSLDARAQKGKIPRRQYKVQRRAIEIRLETLTRNINRIKDVFRSSTSLYADLVKQLDAAETDLVEAEENIKKLESRQSKGEISLETYKKNIGDYQKRKDKAESTINGILLRLREKAR